MFKCISKHEIIMQWSEVEVHLVNVSHLVFKLVSIQSVLDSLLVSKCGLENVMMSGLSSGLRNGSGFRLRLKSPHTITQELGLVVRMFVIQCCRFLSGAFDLGLV